MNALAMLRLMKPQKGLSSFLTQGSQGQRSLSTSLSLNRSGKSSESDPSEKVVMTDDGRVVVCWHPEVDTPYELTKAVPVEALPTDSVLKIQALRPTQEVFKQKYKDLMINELCQLTHTYKNAWYPGPRRHRYKKNNSPLNIGRDREYL